MLQWFRFCLASTAFLILASPAFSQSSEKPDNQELNGVWAYRTLQSKGGEAVTVTGLFLFDHGRFIQHAIHDGEPLSDQLGQAHLGSYSADGNRLQLSAEVGLVVAPTEVEPVESRKDSRHQIDYEIFGEDLKLTFGSGTVQTFQRVAEGDAGVKWMAVEGGSLALSSNYFVLVSEVDEQIVAASGTISGKEGEESLRPDRWFFVRDGKVEYGRNGIWKLSTSQGRLVLAGDLQLQIEESR